MSELAYSMQMRDIINKMVSEEIEKQRPRYRYATVQSFDRQGRKAMVVFNGESGAVQVNMGSIQPMTTGQTVRVEGIGTDKFISDVIGEAYGGAEDYNLFDNPGFEDADKRAKYPITTAGFYYENNASYARSGWRMTMNCGQQAAGEFRASSPISRRPIKAGGRYNYSFWIMRISATTPCALYFNFLNASGAIISSLVAAVGQTLSDGVWIRRSGAFEVPAGATEMYVSWVHTSTATGANYWLLDDVIVTEFPTNLGDVAGELAVLAADMGATPNHSHPLRGKLECNGQAVSRTLYKELFANIGTSYGAGDGSTTFNVPNYMGRTLVGMSTVDSDFYPMGKVGGEKAVALTAANNGPHSHGQAAHSHSLGPGQPFGMSFGGNAGGAATFAVSVAAVNTTTYQGPYVIGAAQPAIDSSGSGTAHNNLQPYAVVKIGIRASV